MTALYLIIAILTEAGWVIAMKLSDGFTKWAPSAVTVVLYLLSVVFLSFATKRMNIGVGYAIWAGSGMALVAVIGVMYFKEPMTAMRLVSLGFILIGIVGLNVFGGGH
ncbi:MAG: multidrug efflux SMR transporter [Planctomycetes bacterium]|nr:multidrug efflux SMR transporter [Planctomycetota bacterium]